MGDLNPAATSLLERARTAASAPTPSAKRRMRAGLLAAVALPAAGASLGKLLVVAAASAAIGSGATLLATRDAEPRVVILHAPAPPPVLIHAPPPLPTDVVAPQPNEPQSNELVQPAAPPAPVPRRSAPAAEPVVPTLEVDLPPTATPMTPDESLAAELEALRFILSRLEAAEWGDAMTALQVFHARFPTAQLQVEADSLEVRALCGLRRPQAAQRLAEDLAARHPENPSVQRVQNACVAE